MLVTAAPLWGSGPSCSLPALDPPLQVFGHIHDYERYWPTYNYTVLPPVGPDSGLWRYVDPQATVHVTSGAGGNKEMRAGTEAPPQVRGLLAAACLPRMPCSRCRAAISTSNHPHLIAPAPAPDCCRHPRQGPCNATAPWCAFQSGWAPQGQQSSDYSHSRLTLHNATHLHWQQYSTAFGGVVDDWWLVQRRHGPFAPPA